MPLDIGSILAEWEGYGFYDYVLPFLFLFAVVFGILTVTKVFGANSKGINAVIAFVVGLMALRFGLVPAFFGEIFPKVGVGLAILVSLVILVALFIPKEHAEGWMIGFYVVGAIIFLVVILRTFSNLNLLNTGWWYEYGGALLLILLMVGVIIAISVSGGPRTSTQPRDVKMFSFPRD